MRHELRRACLSALLAAAACNAPGHIVGEKNGPDLELGPRAEVRYRVRACLDGADDELFVMTHVVATSLVDPPDDVPFDLAVELEGQHDTASFNGPVPFDRELSPEVAGTTECTEGTLITFRRDDPGEGGTVEVTWRVHASIDRLEHDLGDDAAITISIEPEPLP